VEALLTKNESPGIGWPASASTRCTVTEWRCAWVTVTSTVWRLIVVTGVSDAFVVAIRRAIRADDEVTGRNLLQHDLAVDHTVRVETVAIAGAAHVGAGGWCRGRSNRRRGYCRSRRRQSIRRLPQVGTIKLRVFDLAGDKSVTHVRRPEIDHLLDRILTGHEAQEPGVAVVARRVVGIAMAHHGSAARDCKAESGDRVKVNLIHRADDQDRFVVAEVAFAVYIVVSLIAFATSLQLSV